MIASNKPHCYNTGKDHPSFKHGHSGYIRTKEYRCWQKIKARCKDSKDRKWHLYGGKGIAVCPQWENSFSQFLKDMGEAPSPKHSIDRINSNGNYEPSNCRWATYREQAQNMRRNRWLEFRGERLVMAEWCRRLGIKETTMIGRLDICKWSIEKALTTPVKTPLRKR